MQLLPMLIDVLVLYITYCDCDHRPWSGLLHVRPILGKCTVKEAGLSRKYSSDFPYN